MKKDKGAIITASIALAASVIAAFIAAQSSRELRLLEEKFSRDRESRQFLSDKLTKLYVPVSMYLSITKPLFDRFFESTTTEAERQAIEHTLRDYNMRIRTLVVDGALYLEPDAPQSVTSDLLNHLIQWDTVYKLKYESKAWKGPVFAGIEEFGFRRFPDGVDEYFHKTTAQLRRRLHDSQAP